MKRTHALIGAGAFWLTGGIMLLQKGGSLLERAKLEEAENMFSLMLHRTTFFEWLMFVTPIVMLGLLKSRVVLIKAVDRVEKHLQQFGDAVPIHRALPIPFLAVMGGMMGLAVVLNSISIPLALRGIVDLVIGCALFDGSSHFFKRAFPALTPSRKK